MSALEETAPAFVAMAHRIVWCTVSTTDPHNRPRSRILHPIWQWDGDDLVGWIATAPTPLKQRHLAHSAFVSCNYWDSSHDTCTAECAAEWFTDDETCARVWELFLHGPDPVGYDPAIIPPWRDGPTSPAFAALRLDPWRLRVQPGSVMLSGQGQPLTWSG